MKYSMFSIFDVKARTYSQPHSSANVATALREVAAAMQNPDHPFSRFPDDYALFYVGEFDDESGAITPGHDCVLLAGTFHKLKPADSAVFHKHVQPAQAKE